MGDGIGHVAMTGVGLGFLLNSSPIWMATLVAVAGSVAMELIRAYGKTRGDLALALLFYGGMAGGVLLINLSPTGSNANLTSYLFGSLTTVSPEDVTAISVLAAFVVLVTVGLRRRLFAVSQDEEFARVTGLPVRALNLLIAVTAAVTVTVAMRVVGLLLVSALMVVPVAAAQQLTRSFRATFIGAVLIGVAVSLSGTITTYYVEAPPARRSCCTRSGSSSCSRRSPRRSRGGGHGQSRRTRRTRRPATYGFRPGGGRATTRRCEPRQIPGARGLAEWRGQTSIQGGPVVTAGPPYAAARPGSGPPCRRH